jgi:hypothetical protein
VIVSDNPVDFQHSLNYFNSYCIQWKLTVYPNKTKVILFGNRNSNSYHFNLGEHELEITDKNHYLGLTFSASGFLKARQHISQQANKAMHLLFTKTNNSDLPPDLII